MVIERFEIQSWEELIDESLKERAIQSLERGNVLYFPSLKFSLDEKESRFLSPEISDPKSKNISFDGKKDRLSGSVCEGEELSLLKGMMKRYATTSRKFLEQLIPYYTPSLIQAKTSFRPVEIFGRKSSYRKDDTRLHVDAFPSNPTKGQRILRIFTNIHPGSKPRVWRLGEPFEDVVDRMIPRIGAPFSLVASLYRLLGITKELRTPYDHYMLKIHDTMKGDEEYQKEVPQVQFEFPPGSSWIVYTDQVSHAAMSGQHVLEQTFYLPPDGIKNISTSPLKVLEKRLNKNLI